MRLPGKQLGRLLLQPLDAGSDRDEQLGRLAVRALRRRRHREAAMVAHQPAPEAVIDQPGVAIRAGDAEAALPAERERRKAAAIEEQQRLLAALERALHRLGEPRRDVAAARRAFGAQIDRLDSRQVRPAEALRQVEVPVASAPRIDLALDRGGRRGQHDRNIGAAGAHHRHVAGVVAHAVLLLVGGVMLLVDHEQPEIRIGQEQRRARADDDLHLAVRDRAPGAGAQAW